MGDCTIVIRNVPCTSCTQCGEAYFDDDVAMKLEQIVKGVRAISTEIAVVNYPDKVA